jgi:hypothetical protein
MFYRNACKRTFIAFVTESFQIANNTGSADESFTVTDQNVARDGVDLTLAYPSLRF